MKHTHPHGLGTAANFHMISVSSRIPWSRKFRTLLHWWKSCAWKWDRICRILCSWGRACTRRKQTGRIDGTSKWHLSCHLCCLLSLWSNSHLLWCRRRSCPSRGRRRHSTQRICQKSHWRWCWSRCCLGWARCARCTVDHPATSPFFARISSCRYVYVFKLIITSNSNKLI